MAIKLEAFIEDLLHLSWLGWILVFISLHHFEFDIKVTLAFVGDYNRQGLSESDSDGAKV